MSTILLIRGHEPLGLDHWLSIMVLFIILGHTHLVELLLLTKLLIWTIVVLIAVLRVLVSFSRIGFGPDVNFSRWILNAINHIRKLHLNGRKLSGLSWLYLYLWNKLFLRLLLRLFYLSFRLLLLWLGSLLLWLNLSCTFNFLRLFWGLWLQLLLFWLLWLFVACFLWGFLFLFQLFGFFSE